MERRSCQMEMTPINLSRRQTLNNLIRIDVEAVCKRLVFPDVDFHSDAGCKSIAAFEIESQTLKVELISRKKKEDASKQQDQDSNQLRESGAGNRLSPIQTNIKSYLTETDRADENDGRYCSRLFVDLDAASSCKIYSSSEQQFYESKHNTFVSSYHTYVLNTDRTSSGKYIPLQQHYDAIQPTGRCQIKFDVNSIATAFSTSHSPPWRGGCQRDVPPNTCTTSIFRQLSFVSKVMVDVCNASHPITSTEMNALVRSKMSTTRQSKPAKCKRSPRKTEDVGYLQNLILQSDLVLCDPLDEDSDSENDLCILQNEYFSDFCYFDILDLDILHQIFHFLPTRDLAMLKCVCQDFKWLIEFYDIGGVDSKWSESNSYRDDPCMHCGKIKDASGDVSLCRWHPKGYYKDGHYGRHYWICCRQSHEDAAGCLVGVHDNNWTTSRERLCHIPKPKRKPSWNSYLAVIQ